MKPLLPIGPKALTGLKALTLTLSLLGVLLLPAASPLEEIPGTNLVYTAAETDAAIPAIVTNTITGFTDWTFSPPTNATEEIARYLFDYEGGNQWLLAAYNENDEAVFAFFAAGGLDATSLSFGSSYTATRTYIPPRNALGLARLDDLPPLTNSLPVKMAELGSAIAQSATNYTDAAIAALPTGGITTNDVCAIITNATASFTQWTITRNDQDVTAQVSQPFYGDTPYGDAWTVYPLEGDSIPDPFLSGPSRDATALNWTGLDEQNETTRYTATRTSVIRNNLGVAGQSGAVNEILLIGTDGKMYHLRIGSGGSIEVYMEAN